MRMDKRKADVKKFVAGFGAALAATAAAPDTNAAIISLTPNPSGLATSDNTFVDLGIGPNPFDFWQTNASTGKTLAGGFYYGASLNIAGFAQTQFSQLITSAISFAQTLNISTAASGTATYAFRTNANQVGWIRMSLGGTGGVITYLAAAFNDTPGGTIGAGKLSVPEPSSGTLAGLGLLALGAQGVRRHRNRSQNQTAE